MGDSSRQVGETQVTAATPGRLPPDISLEWMKSGRHAGASVEVPQAHDRLGAGHGRTSSRAGRTSLLGVAALCLRTALVRCREW